ncbi:Uncharacterised protein [Mycobacteroides abscessus subsp. abscessus]|nr:Uncharacterised protein [Mycobacteroides abscessus subsp. abscessus]
MIAVSSGVNRVVPGVSRSSNRSHLTRMKSMILPTSGESSPSPRPTYWPLRYMVTPPSCW